jgi:hypothetical protein
VSDDALPPDAAGRAATPEERAEEVAAQYARHLGTRQELLAAHPEVAGLLDSMLDLVEAMHGLEGAPAPPDSARPATPLPPGERLGRYRLFEILGRGGFGTVYRAHDTRHGRDVALKVLHRDRAPAPDAVDRFTRDAVVAALLDHKHIIRLHEAGEHDGTLYLDMEYVRGETLEDRLRRGPVSFREAAELVRKVACALDHAHGKEIVHRDVKPSNILLDEQGEPRLTDFGLARLVHGAPLTETGQLLGTVDYMAPEQAGGPRDVDGRADVYGLGVVLYRLLTGRVPFDDARPVPARLYDIMHTDPPAPRRVNPSVPRDLETICLKAMAKDPADRFTKASDFAEQLRRWLDGESVIRPPSLIERARRWRKRNRRLARAIAATTVVLMVAGAIAIEGNWRAAEQARLRTGVEAREAEVEALALLDQAHQRLRVPTEGRRRETQDLLRRAARLRNRSLSQDRKDAIDLELRSLYAASLGVPELDVTAAEEIDDPERDFTLAWPAAMHPDGEWMAVGTRERPVRWVRGERLAIPPNQSPLGRRPRMAYSPDDQYLAFAPADGGLEVWDGEVTQVIKTLEPRPAADGSAVVALHFGPDAATLRACWDDGRVRCWSLPGGELRDQWRIGAAPGSITAAAFDPAGESLAVGDGTGRVRLVRKGGQGGQEWAASNVEVVALAWAPDGLQVAAATKDGNIQVRSRDEAEARYTLAAYPYGCANVLFSPDGRWLLAGHIMEGMKMWDAYTGEQLLTGPYLPWGFASSRTCFAGGHAKGVAFCDISVPEALRTLGRHRARVEKLTWSRDNRHFVTLDTRFEVRTWDARRGVAIDTFSPPRSDGHAQNAGVAIDDDGRYVAYASGGYQEPAVALVRTPGSHEYSPAWSLPAGFEVMAFVGGRFVLMREEREDPARLGDGESAWLCHSVLYELRADGAPPRKVRVFRESKAGDLRLFLDSGLTADARWHVWVGPRFPPSQRRVEVRDVLTGDLVRCEARPTEYPVPEPQARLSPDRRWLWIATGDDDCWLYDLNGERPAERVVAPPVTICPNGRLFVFRSESARGQSGKGLEMHFGRQGPPWITILSKDYTEPTAPQFSHDGRYAAWGSRAGAVTVADIPALRRQVEAFEQLLEEE